MPVSIAREVRPTRSVLWRIRICRNAVRTDIERAFQTIDVHVAVVVDFDFFASAIANPFSAIARHLIGDGRSSSHGYFQIHAHLANMLETRRLRCHGRAHSIEGHDDAMVRGAIARIHAARVVIFAIGVGAAWQFGCRLERFEASVLLGAAGDTRAKYDADAEDPKL